MFTEKVNTTDTETIEQWKRTHYPTHGDKGIQKTNAKVTEETGFYTLLDVSWYDIFFFMKMVTLFVLLAPLITWTWTNYVKEKLALLK